MRRTHLVSTLIWLWHFIVIFQCCVETFIGGVFTTALSYHAASAAHTISMGLNKRHPCTHCEAYAIPIKRIINDWNHHCMYTQLVRGSSMTPNSTYANACTQPSHCARCAISRGEFIFLPHRNQSSEPMNLEVTAELNERMNDESVLLQFSINSTRSDTCACVRFLFAEAPVILFKYANWLIVSFSASVSFAISQSRLSRIHTHTRMDRICVLW